MKTVYWAVSNVTDFSPLSKALYYEPEPVNNANTLSNYVADEKFNNFKVCPAYLDHVENMYKLRFPVDYDVQFDKQGVRSNHYDQDFFNYFVNMRNFEERFFGFKVNLVFYAEESVQMTLYPPYLEDNDLCNKTNIIPGTFDIGKWFRPIDFACKLKQGHNSITIKRGDVFNYVKFDQPVELKQFDYVEEIERIKKDILRSKMILGRKTASLDWFYSLLKRSKYNTKLTQLIRTNILED